MKADRSNRWGLALAIAAYGCLVAACNMPERTVTPAAPQTEAPAPAPTGAGCTAVDLSAPDVPVWESPISESLLPVFSWFYDGECAADGFRLEVAPDGEFGSTSVLVSSLGAATTSWTPGQDLQPVTRYQWRVAALRSGEMGPYSISPEFWTGPTCEGSDLGAPTLLSPADGAVIDDASPILAWESAQPGCLQAAYNFEVTDDPTFSAAVLEGSSGPSASFETALSFLRDCTPYLWRVRAVFGEDMSGPYSEIGVFTTDLTGACPQIPVLPVIGGLVWQDVCSATWPPPPVLPPGCVFQEGLMPDGVRQEGELPIEGVVVRYAQGACGGDGPAQTVLEATDEQGLYSQYVLPGTYCLWVDGVADGNEAILGRGRLTYPPGGYDFPARYTITVDWGDELMDVGFGWMAIQ